MSGKARRAVMAATMLLFPAVASAGFAGTERFLPMAGSGSGVSAGGRP